MSDPYPVGLHLAGLQVLVVGGGHVAQRRVPGLIAVGALVQLVAPAITPALQGLRDAGELTWHERGFEPADLDGVWYATAATDDISVNKRVADLARERRIFCVRADAADHGTARTPAVGRASGATVAVLSEPDPRRSAEIRDEVVSQLRHGILGARRHRDAGGLVTLIGGGPGDPDLITLAGHRALMEADVVVADRLAPRELLGELSSEVELIDVAKLPRGPSASQDEINRVIVERAQAGSRVVRFKGGDSFIFGRGYEEVLACREAGVPVRVIPGVPSPVAVPAIAGIPLTHRGVAHDFTIASGHLPPGHPESLVDYIGLARMQGTVVLMMAVKNAGVIAETLIEHGRDPQTPVAVVVEGTMPTQQILRTTLSLLPHLTAEDGLRHPAIIVIGGVVAVALAEADAGAAAAGNPWPT